MGVVERASIKSMKADGRMCLNCPRPIDMGTDAMVWTGGPRYCTQCSRPQKVAMRFKLQRSVWCVEFLEPRSRLPLAPCCRFQDGAKIRELIHRTPSRLTLAENQALDLGLSNGLGELDILITTEQLRKLKVKRV